METVGEPGSFKGSGWGRLPGLIPGNGFGVERPDLAPL